LYFVKNSGTISYLKNRLLQNYLQPRKVSQATKNSEGLHMFCGPRAVGDSGNDEENPPALS